MPDYDEERFAIFAGDCRNRLKEIRKNFFDSCVTDPPYNLASIQKRFSKPDAAPAKGAAFQRHNKGFMGKEWDSEVAFQPETWVEILRVLKPGAHLLAFGGTRTAHRLACAIEDAGFEIRDCIDWIYGSGFPKSHDLGQGRGTALKPAHEPIYLARKPFEGTTSACVEEWGTGGVNIDSCRVPAVEVNPSIARRQSAPRRQGEGNWPTVENAEAFAAEHAGEALGRWPANLIHDGSPEVLELFPETKGQQGKGSTAPPPPRHIFGTRARESNGTEPRGDEGSAARFFYCAKASRADREEGLADLEGRKRDDSRNAEQPSMNGGEGNPYNRGAAPRKNHHPTVKPTELMRYLCRLITPPGGIVLDPFMGSGSTGKAALLEGFSFFGCELEEPYIEIAERRLFAAHIASKDRLTTLPASVTSYSESAAEEDGNRYIAGDFEAEEP
jgi:site-specific DNA-methyltransferase (adenine-specific)